MYACICLKLGVSPRSILKGFGFTGLIAFLRLSIITMLYIETEKILPAYCELS